MGKGGEYKSAEKQLAQFQIGQTQVEELADRLQGTIDMTPNSPDEQKLLIKELRLQKEGTQAQKSGCRNARYSRRVTPEIGASNQLWIQVSQRISNS
jgi:hypothetical protein